MAAPVAILAKPEDHRGILTMAEAVDAMLDAFRNWAKDPLVAELRRRTHTPKNVRITLHQGAAPDYGTTGTMTHAELVRIFGDKQKYPRASNIALKKRGYVNQMSREIDERTLERADILMTNVWGQEELDKTAVFWEASLDRPNIARKIVDAGQVIRGEKNGRTDASQITYFKNCAFWGIGVAAIGGLIYDKLLEQRRGLALDFNPHEFYDDKWTED